jgi:hypothetical protein
MPGSSIQFHLSSCLFLCQYHVVFIAVAAGILRNTGTMQTWLPPIKEPEKNNMYGWLPSPNDLPNNVQHLPPFPLRSHFFLMTIPLQPPLFHHRMLKNLSL